MPVSLFLAMALALQVSEGPPAALVRAAGRGNPWVSYRDGRPPTSASPLRELFVERPLEPRSLASADLDEDGTPDLVAGFAEPGGAGVLFFHRGNPDSIYPSSPEARGRKAAGTSSEDAFLGPIHVLSTLEAPDFLAAGDFDADGHADIVYAARGSSALRFLPGKGSFALTTEGRIPLDGRLTALVSGEVNRADGLGDLVVGLDTARGPRVAVLESPGGAARARAELIPVEAEVRSLAIGQADGDYPYDIAAATGHSLMVVRGRDRRHSLALQPGELPPPKVESVAFDDDVHAVAFADLVNDRGGRQEIAVAAMDGSLRVMSREASGLYREVARLSLPEASRGLPHPLQGALRGAKVSGRPADDLLLIGGRTLQIVTEPGKPARSAAGAETAELERTATFDADGEIVAVLPMRLNTDALADLVVLTSNSRAPVVVASAPTSTFVVTSSGSEDDCVPADGLCLTGQSPSCTGPCTLPAALQQASATPGTHLITFAVAGPTPIRIITNPTNGTSTNPVTVDGSTQPGFAGTPVIEIAWSIGLRGGSSVIRELSFSGPTGQAGIGLGGAGNNILEGNYIGLDPSGTFGTGGVVFIGSDSSNNVIGGTSSVARNLFSSGGYFGAVALNVQSSGNQIQGNHIGLDVNGAVTASFWGITFPGATMNNVVGGTAPGARNVIAGCVNHGILLQDGGGNLVQGNYVGTNGSGTAAVPNAIGIAFSFTASSSATIGGTTPAARNVISGNGSGVRTILGGSGSVLVQGNYIGLDASGQAALGNAYGIEVLDSAMTIGGTAPGAGNVISGNTYGIAVFDGARDVVIQGNHIGTDPGGIAAIPNSSSGISGGQAGLVYGVVVGGTAPGERNVISGNAVNGLSITGNNWSVRGNSIGVDVTGAPLPNGGDGVVILGGVTGAVIGTTASGAGNTIASNAGSGVRLAASGNPSAFPRGVSIRGNSISGGNGGLAIDLESAAGAGVTPNDTCDAQTNGANDLQNFPILSLAVVSPAGTTTIGGTLNSRPATTFDVDLYASPACDPSGNGQGTSYLGSTSVTTGADCNGSFTAVVAGAAALGQRITATATATTGGSGTSELSPCTVSAFMHGNLDNSGAIDIFDLVTMANAIVGNVAAGAAPFLAPAAAADVNRSGSLDVFDLVVLANYLVGNIPSLPV